MPRSDKKPGSGKWMAILQDQRSKMLLPLRKGGRAGLDDFALLYLKSETRQCYGSTVK